MQSTHQTGFETLENKEMKKFMLSTAGISAAAIGGAASAGALLTFNYDYYVSESGWTITDSNGDVVATAVAGFVTSAAVSYSSTLTGGGYPGYEGLVDINLAAGDYNITLTDTWGDGWEYFSPTGSGNSAFVYGGNAMAFLSGSSVHGSFTVAGVPAPGALALLGLAGLAGRGRRR